MKKIKESKQPFFAKFLESQKIKSKRTVKGGASNMTMKAPSDSDEN